ncbi:protein of unknown function [Singulisphaera sp. GP187]|uniref:DUF4159 domain-containing protein n=1 Tax=Singulisphaera sp. GP187 TaxID=1882752 RepID=UPI0009287FAB|nr:DUF4159 domain-containing protein [Singulisphaera sp. GP187]SIO41421.1 protein of unknown function [Singulisphaera sp. GP187]
MTRRRLILIALPCLLAIVTGVCLAQPRFGRRPRTRPGIIPDDRAGVPDWKVDERFKKDVFTFVRVEYDADYGGGGGGGFGYGGRRRWGGGGGWMTDWPDSDLNFSFRLQQLTSLKVNPEPISMRVTDERLCDYPFLYMIEPGNLSFSEEEVVALRHYLLNGGFLMIDDFWGDHAWQTVSDQFKRVFPDREPTELSIEHEIFRCVYRLKEKPQVPAINVWENTGETWERHDGDSQTVHYKQIVDDKGRMMVILCHNTDLGDGWEREGLSTDYFHEFSEKKSYPMGINIVTYAMTH